MPPTTSALGHLAGRLARHERSQQTAEGGRPQQRPETAGSIGHIADAAGRAAGHAGQPVLHVLRRRVLAYTAEHAANLFLDLVAELRIQLGTQLTEQIFHYSTLRPAPRLPAAVSRKSGSRGKKQTSGCPEQQAPS